MTLTSENGFQGTVALSLVDGEDPLPQGLGLAATRPSPVSLQPGETLTVTATARAGEEVPPGTYRMRVRAEGGGVARERPLALRVAVPPGFALSLSPTSLTVQQGASATTTLTLTPQGGFQGTVTLSLAPGQDGVPQGLSLSPQSVQAAGPDPVTQTLTLAASASTPTGTYRLKVRGTGQNVTRDVDLTVTVSPPPDFALSLSPRPPHGPPGGSGSRSPLHLERQRVPGHRGPLPGSGSGPPAPRGLRSPPDRLQLLPQPRHGRRGHPDPHSVRGGRAPGHLPPSRCGAGPRSLPDRDRLPRPHRDPAPRLHRCPSPPPASPSSRGPAPPPPSPSPRRAGFTGTVGLSLVAGQDGVPQGLSLSPQSLQVTGLQPGEPDPHPQRPPPCTPAGTYRLKVRATSGSLTREADLTLTVSAPSARLHPLPLPHQPHRASRGAAAPDHPHPHPAGRLHRDGGPQPGGRERNPVTGITLSPRA